MGEIPVISIIVPIYNVEQYLRRCVDSILAQTFTDFELILVDDGSPDGCPAICDAYAQKDSRVRVIHQKNEGLSAARNAGMEISSGKYILFCDSDDYVSPNWCEALISQVRGSHDNFIFGKITPLIEGMGFPKMCTSAGKNMEFPVREFLTLHTQSKAGFAWNVLYYSDVVKRLNLHFRRDIIIEDLPFCLSYLQEMRTLTYCADAEYYYMQRDGATLSRKYYPDSFTKWQQKYALLINFIKKTIPREEQFSAEQQMADFYIYFFLQSLSNTFDKRNPWTLEKKVHYNQSVVKTTEFQHCLRHSTSNQEDERYLFLLKFFPYMIAAVYQWVGSLVCKKRRKTGLSYETDKR